MYIMVDSNNDRNNCAFRKQACVLRKVVENKHRNQQRPVLNRKNLSVAKRDASKRSNR